MKKCLLVLAYCCFFAYKHGFSQGQTNELDSFSKDTLHKPLIHVIAYGESIYSIAKKYNLSPNDLMLWNRLDKNTILDRGKTLLISPPPTASLSTNSDKTKVLAIPEDGIHIVQYGEYPYLIARKYNISPNNLLEWNGLSEHSKLDYGDKLWLINPNQEVKKENITEKETSKIPIPLNSIHEVKYGENIYSIAQKYSIKPNDLLRCNKLTIYSKIDKGMKLHLKSQNE
jgi:LysM repeat protein